MFGKSKGKRHDKLHSAVAQPAATTEPPETISCIGFGVTVAGKFVSEGAVKIFGRFEGELQASDVLIGEGAQVEANVVAQDLVIGGRFKGTIRAMHVKLLGTAVVESETPPFPLTSDVRLPASRSPKIETQEFGHPVAMES